MSLCRALSILNVRKEEEAMGKEYLNQKLGAEKRAQALLKEMSLEEKMAQVNCIFPFGEEYLDYRSIEKQVPYGIGQVSTLEMRRIKTLEEAAQWQRNVQILVVQNSPHHIPAIFHMEGLCGAFIQDAASFTSLPGLREGPAGIPNWKNKSGRLSADRRRRAALRMYLLRY